MSIDAIKDLNEAFNEYFFKNCKFILDNKVVKEGKLKLFTMKGFNLKFFLLDSENNVKPLELPYPFKIVKRENGYLFDYRLSAFKTLKKSELVDNLLEENTPPSKFFNKPLIIKIE